MNLLCPVPYCNSSLPCMPDDPPHLILLDLITLLIFGKESNHVVPHYAVFTVYSAVTSILFGQNATQSTILSNMLRLCSYFNLTAQVSYPCKTNNSPAAACTLIYIYIKKTKWCEPFRMVSWQSLCTSWSLFQ